MFLFQFGGGFQNSGENGSAPPPELVDPSSSCLAPRVCMPDTESADKALFTVSMGSPSVATAAAVFSRAILCELALLLLVEAVLTKICELAVNMFSS